MRCRASVATLLPYHAVRAVCQAGKSSRKRGRTVDHTKPNEHQTDYAELVELDAGTVKSVERERGTGSIAPDRGAQVNLDTGFTREKVGKEHFEHLGVGERVHFHAEPDPDRPGYANATVVEVDRDETS